MGSGGHGSAGHGSAGHGSVGHGSGGHGSGGHGSGGSGIGYRGPSSSVYRPGFRGGLSNNYPRYSGGFGYFPGFYSTFGYGYGYSSPWVDSYYPAGGYVSAPAYYESAPQPPPVVINEFYRPPTAQPRFRDYSNGGYGIEPVPQPTSAPAKKPDYWLIAFPNGTIVLAVAYWTDRGTLHYVTRTKEQKQIPISAIDRELTDQLNQERGLEFRIPK